MDIRTSKYQNNLTYQINMTQMNSNCLALLYDLWLKKSVLTRTYLTKTLYQFPKNGRKCLYSELYPANHRITSLLSVTNAENKCSPQCEQHTDNLVCRLSDSLPQIKAKCDYVEYATLLHKASHMVIDSLLQCATNSANG